MTVPKNATKALRETEVPRQMSLRTALRTGVRRMTASALLLALTVGAATLMNASPAAAAADGWQLQSQVPQKRCLDFDTGTLGNARSNVQLYNCRAAGDGQRVYQLFLLEPIPGQPADIFKIKNKKTGRCATYAPYGDPGSPVWAESCNKAGQGWRWFDAFSSRLEAVEAYDYLCLSPQDYTYGGNMTGIDLSTCWGDNETEPWHNWFLLP